MFGTDSKETLPQRFAQSHKAWDEYMAKIWKNLLHLVGCEADASVIEIGGGNSVKIGTALAQSGFKGSFHLVDPFEEALAEAQRLYCELLPDAQIHTHTTTLAQAKALPQNALLLANHPLDDMILAAGAGPHDAAELFGWTAIEHEQTIPLSLQVWTGIEHHPDMLSGIKDVIFAEWRAAIDTLKPRALIVSQYPSSTLKNAGMNGLNRHALDILKALRGLYASALIPDEDVQGVLNRVKHYNDKHIGKEVLNAANWLVARF